MIDLFGDTDMLDGVLDKLAALPFLLENGLEYRRCSGTTQRCSSFAKYTVRF